jgi:hypothetical protein
LLPVLGSLILVWLLYQDLLAVFVWNMLEVYTGACPLFGVSYACTQENHLCFAQKKEIHLSNFVFFPPRKDRFQF